MCVARDIKHWHSRRINHTAVDKDSPFCMGTPTHSATTQQAAATTAASEGFLWPAFLFPHFSPALAASLPTWSEAHWTWLAAEVSAHGLGPLLYTTLQACNGLFACPDTIWAQLRAQYKHATLVAMQREGELRRVFDALAAAQIRPVVFKGAYLAHTVYPTPGCRPMGDSDLWVTHDEMPHAVAALETLGYQLHEKADRPHALVRDTDGEVQMVPGRPGQNLIELHWGVFPGEWLARTANVDRAGVRSRVCHATIAVHPVLALAPEDALIQLAVHMGISHQMSLHPLRSLVDIVLLAGQGMAWDVVVERARAWRVGVVVGTVLALAAELFELPELAPPAAALVPPAWQQRLLRRFVTPASILARPELSAQKSRFLYLLSVTDRPIDAANLLLRAVWPEPRWLAARYGQAGLRVRARHAADALRGQI